MPVFYLSVCLSIYLISQQEGLAVASIARDNPSTLPGDDSFPRARMHRVWLRGKLGSEFET